MVICAFHGILEVKSLTRRDLWVWRKKKEADSQISCVQTTVTNIIIINGQQNSRFHLRFRKSTNLFHHSANKYSHVLSFAGRLKIDLVFSTFIPHNIWSSSRIISTKQNQKEFVNEWICERRERIENKSSYIWTQTSHPFEVLRLLVCFVRYKVNQFWLFGSAHFDWAKFPFIFIGLI